MHIEYPGSSAAGSFQSIIGPCTRTQDFPGGSVVKSLPIQETQETQVLSLGQEEPLEEEMATHSSVFAWRIPWTEEPGGLQSMGSQESDSLSE